MDEFLKALELVAKFDGCRPTLTKEFRLYYNEDGSIIGLWETDYPTGNYIVLDDPSVFYNSNTLLLQVVDGKLKKIEIFLSRKYFPSKNEQKKITFIIKI